MVNTNLCGVNVFASQRPSQRNCDTPCLPRLQDVWPDPTANKPDASVMKRRSRTCSRSRFKADVQTILFATIPMEHRQEMRTLVQTICPSSEVQSLSEGQDERSIRSGGNKVGTHAFFGTRAFTSSSTSPSSIISILCLYLHRKTSSKTQSTVLGSLSIPGKQYTPRKRAAIAEAGRREPYGVVARRFGCSKSTAHRLTSQLKKVGHANPGPRPGRPPILSPRGLKRIRRLLRQHRFSTNAELLTLLSDNGFPISLRTLQRLLGGKFNLHRFIARFKPFVTARNRQQRRDYAAMRAGDTRQDWRRTIFVDEAFIRLNGTMTTRVIREKGQAWHQDNLVPKLLSAKGSFMVWGAIWHGGRSDLIRFDQSESAGRRGGVTAMIYRDQITKGELKRVWQQVNGVWRAWCKDC